MTTALPGSYEFFMQTVEDFLRANAQGTVNLMILVETSAGQFWTHSMVNNKVWDLGMIESARTLCKLDYERKVQQVPANEVEKQRLAAEPVTGKAN